jgi:predicted DNA binding CopG/RHH family protein
MSMAKKPQPIKIPKFRTTDEEATWWESREGRRVATEIMKRGVAAGTARRSVPLKTISMRLPVADLEAAQELAASKGLPYQTYIKMLIHEALQKQRRSA